MIIEFESTISSKLLHKSKQILYLDYNKKRFINFPLNPNEIIKRVRVNKEFGESRELTDDERKMYGIPSKNK